LEEGNMNEVKALLEKCQALGAIFTPLNDRFRVEAPIPLPDELVDELKKAKPQIMAELNGNLRGKAENWLLEEWRRISIPDWREKLKEATELKNVKREEYARWMLREMLEDPEYWEEK
jgi:hypothetical protein